MKTLVKQFVDLWGCEATLIWNVRIVRKGEKYGLYNCLVYEEEDPVVEFYDVRYPHWKTEFGEVLGQFVSRYYLSTLFEGEQGRGLMLEGNVPEWSISAECMKEIKTWLKEQAGQVCVCPSCGSSEMISDACASWDVTTQEWVLVNTYDYVTCQACGEETFNPSFVIQYDREVQS